MFNKAYNSAKTVKMIWEQLNTPEARKNTLVKSGVTHLWDWLNKNVTDRIFK